MTTTVISDLTSGSINGEGIFDKLMEATTIRLDDAFHKNRITSTDYSTILNAGIATAMQQAISYLLGVKSADAQADLVRAQVLLADQELINSGVQKSILDAQLVQLNAQTDIIVEGLNTALEDTKIKKQQLINLITEDLKSVANVANIEADTLTKSQQLTNLVTQNLKALEDVEIAKADVLLKAQQLTNLITENAKAITHTGNIAEDTAMKVQQKLNLAEEVLKTKQDTANALSTNTVIVNQGNKVLSEIGLLDQKKVSETAQTEATAAPDSVIGKQTSLYQKQTDGFDRDAEQKAAKMALDTWSIRQSTDGALAGPAGINDESIKELVDRMKAGVSAASESLIITLPGGTATGATTATVSVVTQDATGSLYRYISTNANETAGTVLAQDVKTTVTTAGIQSESITGLTTATDYYAHFVQFNSVGKVSEVVSSSAFTTS